MLQISCSEIDAFRKIKDWLKDRGFETHDDTRCADLVIALVSNDSEALSTVIEAHAEAMKAWTDWQIQDKKNKDFFEEWRDRTQSSVMQRGVLNQYAKYMGSPVVQNLQQGIGKTRLNAIDYVGLLTTSNAQNKQKLKARIKDLIGPPKSSQFVQYDFKDNEVFVCHEIKATDPSSTTTLVPVFPTAYVDCVIDALETPDIEEGQDEQSNTK